METVFEGRRRNGNDRGRNPYGDFAGARVGFSQADAGIRRGNCKAHFRDDMSKNLKEENHMKTFAMFLQEEDGMEVINVAILLAIGLGLVIAFKGKLQELWTVISGKMDPSQIDTDFQ